MAQSHLAAPRQFPCNALWDLGKGPKENIEIFVRSSLVKISIAIIIILILFLLTGYTRGVMYGKIDCM